MILPVTMRFNRQPSRCGGCDGFDRPARVLIASPREERLSTGLRVPSAFDEGGYASGRATGGTSAILRTGKSVQLGSVIRSPLPYLPDVTKRVEQRVR